MDAVAADYPIMLDYEENEYTCNFQMNLITK